MAPFRPQPKFRKNKDGEIIPDHNYYKYLEYLVSMNADERLDWKSLGVHITMGRERRIECLDSFINFLTADL